MILFTSPNCDKCNHIKQHLPASYTERPATDLEGCELWEDLVWIKAELVMRNWNEELPLLVVGHQVMEYHEICLHLKIQPLECEDGSCKLETRKDHLKEACKLLVTVPKISKRLKES